jgi:small-conductance mechanosensitive channel
MDNIIKLIQKLFSRDNLLTGLQIVLIVVIGFGLVQLIKFLVNKSLGKRMSKQSKMLVNKAILYLGWFIIVFMVLNKLGVNLKSLLAAAGAAGIVIGIASQTSLGNAISGIFILSEKSFEVGHVIKVGSATGIVHSVDLLSIKIRTFDNTLIRIPNQTLIASEFTNFSMMPIRRLDFDLKVHFKENLYRFTEILKEVVKNNPDSLDEPGPLIVYKEFGESTINILLGVWFEKTKYLAVKNGILLDLKDAFEKEGINVPVPVTAVKVDNLEKEPV